MAAPARSRYGQLPLIHAAGADTFTVTTATAGAD